MVSADTKLVIERAKRIYAEQLRAVLESQHLNRYVAIEPESGEYFLGDTFDEAVKSAACFLDWFGNTYKTQIATSDGDYPLLGTMLLVMSRSRFAVRFRHTPNDN